MTKTFKLSLLTFCTLLFNIKLFAQIDSSIINRNLKALERQAANIPIEKVHLHLDRPWYGIGDTIRFKAYVVIGFDHRLSGLSGVLYTELIDDRDSVIKRLTLQIVSGVCNGEIALPTINNNNAYRLRAYTNWMRNNGGDYLFDKKVIVAGPASVVGKVGNGVKGLNSNVNNGKAETVDVQFFPEGGSLINNLRSKVAVKVVNKQGFSEEVQGVITDSSGIEIFSFATQHAGMGIFPLTPQKGNFYKARITMANGKSFSVDLPPAKSSGFSMTINNADIDTIYVKIAANTKQFTNKPDTAFYLLAQSAGKNYFAAAGNTGNGVFAAKIAKSRFPSGIVQFTLFSQTGEPMNERLVFIQNNDQVNLQLSSEKQVYGKGERVNIEISKKDQSDHPSPGTYSIAVTDLTKVPVDEQTENTIFTDLLLKSDLKGYIEQPNYYFKNPNEQTQAYLDLLMLTQGYRTFDWRQMLSGANQAEKYSPEKGLSISGFVKTPLGKPVTKAKVLLTSIKDQFAVDALTDENGKFTFTNLNLPDSTKVVINAKKSSGKNNVVIYLNNPAYQPVNGMDEPSYIPSEITEAMKAAYSIWQKDSLSHTIQLKEVKVKDKKFYSGRADYASTMKYSANLNGPGIADQVFMADDLMIGPFPGSLNGRLFGIQITHGTAYSTKAIKQHLTGLEKPMAIYVDGTQLSPGELNTIAGEDIYSIEVLTSAMYLNIYGNDAAGGALIITTKNGAHVPHQSSSLTGVITYNYIGYYKVRNFYSPRYDVKSSLPSADLRKTIYWDPHIFTDAQGKASIQYYNALSEGTYRVVIEGIDDKGKLARQTFNYRVQ